MKADSEKVKEGRQGESEKHSGICTALWGRSKLPLSPRTPASFVGFPGAVSQGWKLFLCSSGSSIWGQPLLSDSKLRCHLETHLNY